MPINQNGKPVSRRPGFPGQLARISRDTSQKITTKAINIPLMINGDIVVALEIRALPDFFYGEAGVRLPNLNQFRLGALVAQEQLVAIDYDGIDDALVKAVPLVTVLPQLLSRFGLETEEKFLSGP